MNFLDALILGLVEGLTEFLPISSTFHLIFVSKALGTGQSDFAKLFNVFIQSGAILAVLAFYWKNLRRDGALVTKTLAAFFPTVVLGTLFYAVIKQVFFESLLSMTAVFILVGILFFVFEWMVRKGLLRPLKPLSELTYGNAIIIGIAQCLAFLPGVSRAGAVILAMMILGFRRADAAAFSFLLAVPTLLAAGAYDLYKTRETILHSANNVLLLVVGSAVAFAVAYLAVKWFIRYLQRHTLHLFGFYRFIVGSILLLVLLLG
ncbi:MAG: undecaprenyl-diphosphate phosphatase [Clostridiales bacterium]|nr:undecaprenyl-diphosphate phosphatase [Clostridiales bacterium]